MKKILYLSNIEVPYRVKFFNELAKECELTVLYERKKSANRNEEWATSNKKNFKTLYAEGFNVKNENSFSFKIFKEIFNGYDAIIVGCYNSPIQILIIFIMKIFNINFYINVDGESFIKNEGFKNKIKTFLLKGATGYFVAGEKSAQSLSKIVKQDCTPYYFSSLSADEIRKNSFHTEKREQYILVVGQYFDYKGLDIAVEVAKMDESIKYKFVGMDGRTEMFIKDFSLDKCSNIEVIPFLQKELLELEYRKCSLLLLPTKQECWGLVINEAASFGTPIVSTYGSGAAVEFLEDNYYEYLAEPQNANDLFEKVKKFLSTDSFEKRKYSEYLVNKSRLYTIENSVKKHIEVLDKK